MTADKQLTPESRPWEWVPEPECASIAGLSVPALRRLRSKGEAPAYIRVTPRGEVLYSRQGIDDFLLALYLKSPVPPPETETIEEL